jgi:hypothetical protein
MCKYTQISEHDRVTTEVVAGVFDEDEVDVVRYAQRAVRKVQVALVVDAYLTYVRGTVPVNTGDRKTHALHMLFDVGETTLRTVLDRKRYEKWLKLSGATVPFEDVLKLLDEALPESEIGKARSKSCVR